MRNLQFILLTVVAFPVLVGCGLLTSSASTPSPVAQTLLTVAPHAATQVPSLAQPTASSVPTSARSTATLTPTVKAATPKPAPSRTSAPTIVTRKILYSQCDASCAQPADAHLWIANADGTHAIKIIDYGYSASFAPDGTRLAFENTQGGIYVAKADGSGQVRIVQGTNVGEPDWSHDGKKIAFVERTRTPNSTGPETQPGPPPPPPCIPGVNCKPYILFDLSLDTSNVLERPAGANSLLQLGNVFIEVVAPDGSGRRTVTTGNHPTWSADDSLIAYDTCVGGSCGIYKIADGGGTPIKVTDDVGSIPHWSHDGKKILYGTDVEGVRQLFVVNADGSGKKQLTTGKEFHVDGIWSMDDSSILYRSTEGGSWGVWTMKADGTSPHRILSNIPPVNWGNEKLSASK